MRTELPYRMDVLYVPYMAMRSPEVLNEALKAMNRFCLLFVLSVTSIANARELPLPQVPAELRTAGERADYLLEHFWDRMDFTDASALGDTAFIEGSFANFASVMPHASKDGQAAGVARLMDAAKVSPVALSVLMKVAERYLYEPHSPVYCEECFEPFARYALANDLNAERMELLLEDMEQNAPGNAAPDLCLLSEGETVRLGGLFKSGIPSLLLFYDSGCDGCRRLIAALAGDEGFCRMVAQGRVNVIAVNLSGDGGKAPMSRIPLGWVAATACSAHEARDTYALRSTPALYLIGADGRIVLKNATLPRLGRYLRLNPGN